MDYEDEYYLEEDKLGMTITAGSVSLEKNESNLIGISIGGGGKYCPCLYVVQVFDNTAASREGTLQSGDEIRGVNTHNVKGKSKTEVAQLIQRSQGTVTIHYNKLHPDPKQGKSLDIVLKKVKHRLVETMSSSTADAMGLSRAILCNDSLVKKLDELTKAEEMYRALIDHAKLVFKAFFDLIQIYKKFGDVFCSIGVREIQQSANEAFNQFGEAHRLMERHGIQMLKRLKPILGDLGTYLHKAIPDTRLTIKRYADIKFEYLSYCLKVKEMDDEEIQFAQIQEPLYRVETGNYEYRLILRCRQEARSAFARLRSDVLVKLELLDSKHVQHLTQQLTRLVSLLASYHTECEQLMHDKHWFPIELDLAGTTLYTLQDDQQYHDDEDAVDEPEDDTLLGAVEATEDDTEPRDPQRAPSPSDGVATNEELLGQLQNLGLDDGSYCSGNVMDTTSGDMLALAGEGSVALGYPPGSVMSPMSPESFLALGGGNITAMGGAVDGIFPPNSVLNAMAMQQQQQQLNMGPMQPHGMMGSLQPQNTMIGGMQPQNMSMQPQTMMNMQPQTMMSMQPQTMMNMQPQNMSMQPQTMMNMQPQNMSMQPQNMPGMQQTMPVSMNMMNIGSGNSNLPSGLVNTSQCLGNVNQSGMSVAQDLNSGGVPQTDASVSSDSNPAHSSSLSESTIHNNKSVGGSTSSSSATQGGSVSSLSTSNSETKPPKRQQPPVASGLSQLSQELLSEPSVDKQLEGFMSPNKTFPSDGGGHQGPDVPLLGSADDANRDPSSSGLLMPTGSQGSSDSINRKGQEQPNKGQLEDVNLLDSY